MKWPKRFPVGTVSVELGESEVIDEDLHGYFTSDGGSPRVVIDKALKDGAFRDAVIAHEVVHAWLRTYGLNNHMSDAMEESFCDTLGHCLIQFLEARDAASKRR